MDETEIPSHEAETESAIQRAVGKTQEMLGHHAVFQDRARAWVASPAFDAVYKALNTGFFLKCGALIVGAGRLYKMRSPILRARYRRLSQDGELHFASLVMANQRFFDEVDRRFPAVLLNTRDQDAVSLVRGSVFANELGDSHTAEERSESIPKSQAFLAGETYIPLRRHELPLDETSGLVAWLVDVEISATEVAYYEEDAYPYIPLLLPPAAREQDPFVPVPWRVLFGVG